MDAWGKKICVRTKVLLKGAQKITQNLDFVCLDITKEKCKT